MASSNKSDTTFNFSSDLEMDSGFQVPAQTLEPSKDKSPAHDSGSRRTDGYANFVRLLCCLNVLIVPSGVASLKELAPIGQGASFIVRYGKLARDIQSPQVLGYRESLAPVSNIPLKCNMACIQTGRPHEVDVLPQGMTVVSKHINFRHVSQATGGISASKVLEPFEREILILSHDAVRACIHLPTLLGVGAETSPYDNHALPQMYPYLLMEMGRNGNSEEFLREMWRRDCPRPNVSQFDSMSTAGKLFDRMRTQRMLQPPLLPWALKINISISIAKALSTLHCIGVVHGDVKLANTLVWTNPESLSHPDPTNTLVQICDFGSSILLSDIEPGQRVRMVHHSPPWNAPETTEVEGIDRDLLKKTDIYSFGLVFGQIMLQGNHPFDDNYHIMTGQPPTSYVNMEDKVKDLKRRDAVADHLMQLIMDSGLYTDWQIMGIKAVLTHTVRTDPSQRTANLDTTIDFLLKPLDIDKRSTTNPSDETMNQSKGSKTDLLKHLPILVHVDVNLQMRIMEDPKKDHYVGPRDILPLHRDIAGVPDFLDPFFLQLRWHGPDTFVFETFKDLLNQAHNPGPKGQEKVVKAKAAAAAYQVSLCFFHGWGVEPNEKLFMKYLQGAADLGSQPAAELLNEVQWWRRQIPVPLCLEFVTQSAAERPSLSALCKLVVWSLTTELPRVIEFLMTNSMDSWYCESSAFYGHMQNTLSIARTKVEVQLLRQRLDVYPEGHIPPLHAACLRGDLDAVKQILDNNVDLNKLDDICTKTTPLVAACSNGQFDIAAFLLKKGADPRKLDCSSRAPLHYLARFFPEKVSRIGTLLIEKGASETLESLDLDGLSPLAFVADGTRSWLPASGQEACKFLMNLGAKWDPPALSVDHKPLARAFLSGNLPVMFQLFVAILIDLKDRRPERFNNLRAFGRQLLVLMCKEPQINLVCNTAWVAMAWRIPGLVWWMKPALNAPWPGFGLDPSLDMALQLMRIDEEFIERHSGLIFESANGLPLSPQGGPLCLTEATDLPECPDAASKLIDELIRDIAQFRDSQERFLGQEAIPILRIALKTGAHAVARLLARRMRNLNDMETIKIIGATRNFGFVSDLLRLGLDFQHSEMGANILHVAAIQRWPVDLVRRLCQEQQGTDLNTMVNQQNEDGFMPFDLAVFNGYFMLASYFVDELHADVSSPHITYTSRYKSYIAEGLTLLGYGWFRS